MLAAAILICLAVDGDTLTCQGEHVRLIAIDAPEMAGHCRPGRICAAGDPVAAKRAMAQLVQQPVTVERLGRDIYGRTLAIVRADGVNLSCTMIASGNAVYVARWDRGGRVARECGL